jgi:hypothetical protein
MYFHNKIDLRVMSYNDEYVKTISSGSCPVTDFVITGVEIPPTAATVLVIAV